MQDADLLLYFITKIMQLIYEDKIVARRITFTCYDYLKRIGRVMSNSTYAQVIKSLQRLSSMTLRINKKEGTEFYLIDSFYCYKNEATRKLEKIEVVLSDRLYNEVVSKKIITINPNYLKLKPLEKKIYQLAKIHCRHDLSNTEFTLDYFIKK